MTDIASIAKSLKSSSTPRLDAELLLCHVLGVSRTELLALAELDLNQTQAMELDEMLTARKFGTPLAHILGKVEFYGLEFSLSDQVLVPRPETELLIDWAKLELPPAASVVDVGTGSGAIAVALKTVRPDLAVAASDNSAAALAVAAQNVERHQVEIELINSDLLAAVASSQAIIANLPYLPTSRPLDPSVRREPAQALLSGTDGLDHYRRLFDQLDSRPNTLQLFIEAEPDQLTSLEHVAESADFKLVRQLDYAYYFQRGAS